MRDQEIALLEIECLDEMSIEEERNDIDSIPSVNCDDRNLGLFNRGSTSQNSHLIEEEGLQSSETVLKAERGVQCNLMSFSDQSRVALKASISELLGELFNDLLNLICE